MSILNIGATALQVYQRALNTTGHNIANTNTPGYSRQEAIQSTANPQFIGNGYQGNGVQLDSIRRLADQFVITQVRQDTASYFDINAYNVNISQLDNILAEEATGLSVGLDKFFSALQAASNDPTSVPARQLVLSEAEGLTSRFNLMHQTLTEQSRAINTEITALVNQINQLGSSIAGLNAEIAVAQQGPAGSLANDLLDKRDELMRELSELVGVQVVEQDGNIQNVFIGKGQPLVIGGDFSELQVRDDSLNPGRTEVFLDNNGGSRKLTEELSGGTLGGLIRYRDSVLDPTLNQIGLMALGFMQSFNTLQRDGLDLNGNFGEDLFTDINDPSLANFRVNGAETNTAPDDRVISVQIDDVQSLVASDYRLTFPGPDDYTYVIERVSDGSIIRNASLAGQLPETIVIDGLEVTFESGSFQAFDEFMLRPYRSAAEVIDVEITDPTELAFAAAIRAEASLSNSGTGSIDQGEVLQVYDADTGAFLPAFATPGQLSPPLLIRFTTPTTYEVLDNSDPANPVQLDPPIRNQPFVPGTRNEILINEPGTTIASTLDRGNPAGDIGQVVLGAANGYSADTLQFTTRDPATGLSRIDTLNIAANASAQEIANQLNQLEGVSATAFNQIELAQFAGAGAGAYDLYLNGEQLNDPALGPVIGPDALPGNNSDYVNFLAERINNNGNLQQQGIYAIVSESGGAPSLKVFSTSGVDLNVQLTGGAADTLVVSNGESGANLSQQTVAGGGEVTVGGSLDVTLADGITMVSNNSPSPLFGDTQGFDFQQDAFLGYQAVIQGRPQPGDTFSIDFNENGSADNRNAFKLANLATGKTLSGGSASFDEFYARTVEFVGVNTSQSRIDLSASEALLEQSTNLQQSRSGVNLDEEAANLIRFEQAYNAASQLISVGRSLFDTLLSAFR